MTGSESDGVTVIEHSSPGVGSRLAAARERMGWALPDVAATLRIREPHLRAIEAGHSAELPAPAYAIGFVRSYATLLGLDPDDMARRYRAELGGEHRNTDLQFPAPVPARGVPAGAVVLLGAVIAVGAYIGWYRLSGERPAPEPVIAAPDRPVTPAIIPPAAAPSPPSGATASTTMGSFPPGADAAAPPPTSPMTARQTTPPTTTPPTATPAPPPRMAAATPDTAPSVGTPSPAANTGTTTGTTTAAIPPTSPESAPAVPHTTATTTPSSTPMPAPAPMPTPAPALASASPAGPEPGSSNAATTEDAHILLRARADSWVEVHDRKGHVLLNRILHSGETWPVPNQPEGAPQLLLTTGNAGGTEIVVDGTPAPPLGAVGKVRRNVPLGAALMSGGAPAPANSGPHSSSPAQ